MSLTKERGIDKRIVPSMERVEPRVEGDDRGLAVRDL
jgi:hypothetical protein